MLELAFRTGRPVAEIRSLSDEALATLLELAEELAPGGRG